MDHLAAPAAQEPEQKPPKETPKAKPPKAEKQDAAPMQQEKGVKEQQKKAHEQSKQESKEPKQLGGKNEQPAARSARIPDRDFKAHFGKPHTFKAQQVIATTEIVPNQTRFVYVGYTFVFVDPWPSDWLLTDDCYIDYVDGEYFLLDPFHPGIQVALLVVG